MLVNRDQNYSKMTAGNTSGHAPYQYGISTAIERWGLVYQKVGKGKMVSEYKLNKIL